MPATSNPKARVRNTAGLLCALAALGCGKLDRVGECRALAATVNPALDSIESLAKKNSHDGYRAAAAEYGRLVEKLRAQPRSAIGAKELAQEYTDTLSEVPQRLSEYAVAVRDDDAARRDRAAQELARVRRREQVIVGRIGSYCAGR